MSVENKRQVLGILAHVDAGKTTLSESLLYVSGALRRMGRVDHRDAFLDTDLQEKERGITIYSKQAVFDLCDVPVTLVDTPGHVDFSAETERTLSILDYAVLLISGPDGVQGHTETLLKLLHRYGIPFFIFVNKMDLAGCDLGKLMDQLKQSLGDTCVSFSQPDRTARDEEIAVLDEHLLERYLSGKTVSDADIARLTAEKKLHPCYFGSALKVEGIEAFAEGLRRYMKPHRYPDTFGARVYQIRRDERAGRLSLMKITGGRLRVKDEIQVPGEEHTAKVERMFILSGNKARPVEEAEAGQVVAVSGLDGTKAGGAVGIERAALPPLLEPVLHYQVFFPQGQDAFSMLPKFRELEEENPQLKVAWDEEAHVIRLQLMGAIEIEVLTRTIQQRYGVPVEFDAGSIIYKETIASAAEGIGHFEPLRHYAEVHLLLEPGEPGSGMQYASTLSTDVLALNWQRLVLSHLEEKEHRGVLTGAPLTDVKITLVNGRAHVKHTEGGDFREATLRAVRQGLMKARSVLLEPMFAFHLDVLEQDLGRALGDIQRMYGTVQSQQLKDGRAMLEGRAPVETMHAYTMDVAAYTRGSGHLTLVPDGYAPCHNTEEVMAACVYDPEADLANPPGSVFCAHGSGFLVPWDQVEAYMHLEAYRTENSVPDSEAGYVPAAHRRSAVSGPVSLEEEKELEAIFERTYGKIQRREDKLSRNRAREEVEAEKQQKIKNPYRQEAGKDTRERYLLIDGYNILFAWEELKDLAEVNLEAARDALMDILSNYQGYTTEHLILVFDAYKVKDNPGEYLKWQNLDVVYTKEAQTADQYIERTVHEIAPRHHVTVATSDALEQLIIWGEGATRLSARQLLETIESASGEIREILRRNNREDPNRPFQAMHLEKVVGNQGKSGR